MSELERGVSSLKAALERSGYFDKPHGGQVAYEMSGLREIVGNTGTLHGIEGPPEPEAFETEAEYCARHHAWQDRITYWHATVERPFWHDDCLPIEAPR